MPLRPIIACIALILLPACARPPVNNELSAPLKTVDTVDLDRYLGVWYEIARLPNRFERDCEGVTAEYSRRADSLISVVNSCRKGAPNGKLAVAKGRARIIDQSTNAKLEVSFFGPFWGDYWIIDLAEDYSLAVVGEPSGRYLWVLSRTPSLDQVRLNAVLARLRALGYDTSKLYYPAQPPASDGPDKD